MSDNDLSMIYEFLFADTSTYGLDTFTALDARMDESLGMGSGSIEYGVWSFSAA